MRGWFLTFWRDNGGLTVFGYPISEEVQEGTEVVTGVTGVGPTRNTPTPTGAGNPFAPGRGGPGGEMGGHPGGMRERMRGWFGRGGSIPSAPDAANPDAR